MSQYTILCVDSEDTVDELCDAVEATESLTTVRRYGVDGAIEAVADRSVDCLVTGYHLSGGTGVDLIEAVREQHPELPCILCASLSPTAIDTTTVDPGSIEYYNRKGPEELDNLGFVVEDVIIHNTQASFLLPDDEQSRLAALEAYDVETLPVEESFDRLTGLIASHFDISVAFIGLIDRSTEQFVACTGADWDQMARADSICTHSMLQEDVMVVEDIIDDARFTNNETLHELNIVSYAGANLTTPDGNTIGQVCVIDDKPRTYSEDERHDLESFAELAMEVLELRRAVDGSSVDGGNT